MPDQDQLSEQIKHDINAPELHDVHAYKNYLGWLGLKLSSFDRSGDGYERLGPLRRLLATDNVSIPISLAELEDIENNPHPYAPTLGIEIEVYRSTMLSKEERALPESKRNSLIKQKQKKLEEVTLLGFPRDESDTEWWEFALKPANSAITVMSEVLAMDSADIIDLENHYYPLHLTVGGVSLERLGGEQVFLLARALEATGWASSFHRLMMPYARKGEFWKSGRSGVYERAPKEIESTVSGTAVEIRTFAVKGSENLEKTLELAYCLGSCLSAYQDLHDKEAVKSALPFRGHKTIDYIPRPVIRRGAEVEDCIQLSYVWSWYSKEVSLLFQSYGLKEPAHEWVEPSKGTVFKSRGDFGDLADLIAPHSESSEQIQGAAFVESMRGLSDKLIAEVKKIMGTKYGGSLTH